MPCCVHCCTACLCIILLATSAVAGEICSLALHDNAVRLEDGTCSCPPGYHGVYEDTNRALAETTKWWCEPCAAGFFKNKIGVEVCSPCPSDYTWSAVGQAECFTCDETSMLTPQTRHTRCIPCPSDMMTLWTYIDRRHIENIAVDAGDGEFLTMNRDNVARFQSVFFIDERVCRSPQLVTNIDALVRPRSVCQAGTHTRPVASTDSTDDRDTVCDSCLPGKYSDTNASVDCKNVTQCVDARWWDRTGLRVSMQGRKIDSVCVEDWNAVDVQAGRYPLVVNGESFEFRGNRHVEISRYEACIATTEVKCGILADRCTHNFVGGWQQKTITLASAPQACIYRCQTGMHLENGECVPCAPGTYKTEGMLETESCEICAAGKYTANTQSETCIDCAVGKFSTKDRTRCENVCIHNTIYTPNDVCYQTQRSYIIELPLQLQTHRINVQPCPTNSDVILTGLSPWDPSSISYLGVGIAFCRESTQCNLGQKWHTDTRACVACGNIANAVNNAFQYGCLPTCLSGFFPTPVPETATTTHRCTACENSLQAFDAAKCGPTFFLNDTCSEPNKNTPCLPCSSMQKAYQVLDTANVKRGAYSRAERCIFKCRDAEFVGGKSWHYFDIATAGEMLGLSTVQLVQKLASSIVDFEEVFHADLLCETSLQ